MQIELNPGEAKVNLEQELRFIEGPGRAVFPLPVDWTVSFIRSLVRIALFHRQHHTAILNRVRDLEGERAEWREEIERLEQQRDKALDDLAAMTKSRDDLLSYNNGLNIRLSKVCGERDGALFSLNNCQLALKQQKAHCDYLSSVLQDLKKFLAEKENAVIS